MPVPRRPVQNSRRESQLPSSVPIVGLGCSSFSTFFWDGTGIHDKEWTPKTMEREHPRVQEWIRTIHYAVEECGINLLDTAPWYGHGTSEVVIGWALDDWDHKRKDSLRDRVILNTKVGRYEADPKQQFDFSYKATMESAKRSLVRMKCEFVDVLQLHDPEFSPTLDLLLQETIPAMLQCQKNGWCRSLGMTGYPLAVQHQVLQASMETFGRNIWDQALTYCHFNLHDQSLFDQPLPDGSGESYAAYCQLHQIVLMAAAPLSMGLLTSQGPRDWHPASPELKQACAKAVTICQSMSVDISTLALTVALSEPRIPCTLLGMKDVDEVKAAAQVANRFQAVNEAMSRDEILKQTLTESEYQAYERLRDPVNGPFAEVWKSGDFRWDGVQEALEFWKQVEGVAVTKWQETR